MLFGHLCAHCDIAIPPVAGRAICPGCGADVSWAPEYKPTGPSVPHLQQGALVSDLLAELSTPNPEGAP